jgi:peptidoglycan/xylan/chitin deacetylase (PgdA/CDA1 family)
MRVNPIKQQALLAAKGFGSWVDRYREPPHGVVILIYLRIDDGPREIAIPQSLFDDEMAWLAESARVVSLEDALVMLESAQLLPASPIVITFDDGSSDFLDCALPVLVKHDLPSTLYVTTRFVETRQAFPDGARALSWSGITEAVGTGLVSVGSHTHNHAILNRLRLAAVEDELDHSVFLIEERLGLEALDFAYPKAIVPSAGVDALVRHRFRSAAVGGGVPNRPGETDPHRLSRTFIQRSDGWRWFTEKADGGLAAEDTLRRAWDRCRYSLART